MRHCIYCGMPIEEDDRFCVRCGKEQPDSSVEGVSAGVAASGRKSCGRHCPRSGVRKDDARRRGGTRPSYK